MIVSKVHNQPKPNVVVVPQSSLGTVAMVADTLPSQETAQTRERAYELYESRGRAPGHDEQDWLRAEREILTRAAKGLARSTVTGGPVGRD
jgi:hypothetical protein